MGKLRSAVFLTGAFLVGYVMGSQNSCDSKHRRDVIDKAKELSDKIKTEYRIDTPYKTLLAQVNEQMSEYSQKPMNFYIK